MDVSHYNSIAAHKELIEMLDRKNAVKAFITSIVVSLLTPVMLLVVQFSGAYGDHTTGIKILLTLMVLFELSMAGIGFLLISQEELDKIKLYYRLVFAATAIMLLMFARLDMKYTGSVIFYIAAAVFFAVVPVYQDTERKVLSVVFTLGIFISALTISPGIRRIIDTAVIGLGTTGIGILMSDHFVEHERLCLRLKAKTHTSEHDPLTGLVNRRGLDKKASVLWPYCARTATALGLIEVDIDFFKKYNDKFGHPAGDKCLKLVANAIRRSAKRGSDITARTGGEEFLVFVQGMSEPEIVELAMKIRKSIMDLKIPHAYVNVSNYVTVSIGVATMVPDGKNSFQKLYEETDIALYNAKANGRNCVVCRNKIYGRMKKGLATVISG